MINLLPPAIKSELRFARYNARLQHYLWLVVAVSLVLAVIFGGTIFYLNLAEHQAQNDLASSKLGIASFSTFEKTAKSTSDRLAAIKAIQASQTHFSLLLQDIAKVLPQNTSLDGITLTGDSTKPVQISILANSYDNALAFRNALATSPRIAGVDLVSIAKVDKGYAAAFVLAFKPGAAR